MEGWDAEEDDEGELTPLDAVLVGATPALEISDVAPAFGVMTAKSISKVVPWDPTLAAHLRVWS